MLEFNKKKIFRHLMVTIVLFGFGWGFSLELIGADNMYVQSLKGVLRTEPKASGAKIATLKRGDKVEVMNKKGVWVQAKSEKFSGWISRLFLSKHRPVGKTDLNKKVPTNLEKASRRRAASYAVSASTRGLMTSERVRSGRELYRSDYEALEALEKTTISEENVEEFWKSGKLTIQ